MNGDLDRDEVVRLLGQLGSEQDADALQAARDLHTQISAAGIDWDVLLVPAEVGEPSDADDEVEAEHTDPGEPSDADDEAEAEHTDPDSTDAPPSGGGKKGKQAGTLELIDKLLAMPDRSEALREELEEYKADIANGEFAARDHQYVRALYNRLT